MKSTGGPSPRRRYERRHPRLSIVFAPETLESVFAKSSDGAGDGDIGVTLLCRDKEEDKGKEEKTGPIDASRDKSSHMHRILLIACLFSLMAARPHAQRPIPGERQKALAALVGTWHFE